MACGVCMGINSDRCPVCGKDTQYVPCPDCDGKGYKKWYAVDIRTGEEVEITDTAWMCLPPTASQAYTKGDNYYRGYREQCDLCDGTGEVEFDPAFDYEFYDDPDEYHERQLEEKYG